MTAPAPWDVVRRRVNALPPERQVAFALACAEHLVSVVASQRETELRDLLGRGWRVLEGTRDNLAPLRDQLEQRDDLDDDEVAGVCFALGAVMGSPEDAWWAAMRAWDAAYERVPYEPQDRTFRPLALDTADPAVQHELAWQTAAVVSLELDEPLHTLVARLRS